MNTLRSALVPGLIVGIVSVFTSWLWMGVVFHRYQRETPGTWRPEGSRSYIAASLLHIFAAFGLACLYILITRFHVGIFGNGIQGGFYFAICVWGAVSLPMILESAVFVNFHPLVILGELLDWLTTSVLACVFTAWFSQR